MTDNNPTPVLVPLVNPNEPEALLAHLSVQEGQFVHKGDPLATFETTKSTFELTAEVDGFLLGLQLEQGASVRAGQVLAYLSPQADWQPPQPEPSPAGPHQETPANLRITQPAMELARSYNLDLSQLPSGVLVTEATVRALLKQPPKAAPEIDLQAGELLIYGGGGHCKMLIDSLRSTGVYTIAGIIDDGLAPGKQVMGVPVLGGKVELVRLFDGGAHLAANAVGGIGNIQTRINVFQVLQQHGFALPALVHAAAIVEPSSLLASGAQIFARAYIGSEARIGLGCIINTGVIVSHDCLVSDYANISPGAILAGEVQVGSGALIGMGATVNLRVKIGERARIGNGATVKEDVPPGAIVRAGSIWPA